MVTPSSLLAEHFWITCYATLALGFLVPVDADISRLLVPPSLVGILFFTALSRDTASVTAALSGRRLRVALWLTALKMVALPLLVMGLCVLFAPAWTTALVLVTAVPAGLSSPTLAGLYRPGAIAPALATVMVSSLIAPFTLPLILNLTADSGLSALDLGVEQAKYVAVLLGGPWILSRVVRRAAPKFIVRQGALFRPIAVSCLAFLVFVAAATCRSALELTGPSVGFVGLVLVTVEAALIGGVALLVSERLPGDEAVAFPCAVIFMNNGLGVALAARFFPDDARVLVAAALVEVPILLGVHLVGTVAARRANARI